MSYCDTARFVSYLSYSYILTPTHVVQIGPSRDLQKTLTLIVPVGHLTHAARQLEMAKIAKVLGVSIEDLL